MAAKKPSAKATKAKQTVVKKSPAVKEPAKDSAKKAAPAKKAPTLHEPKVAARPKPAAAPAPRPTAASAHAATKADKSSEPIKPAAAPASKPVAAAAHTVSRAAHKPAAAPVTASDDESVTEPAPATPVKPTNSARPVISHPITNSQDTDASGDSDDSEGQDLSSLNLLAGPRNVKPYIARRGEQYMNKEQLEHFRQILNTWKRDLMQEVDRTVLHMKDEAANFPDPNDRATQESEFSLELRTRDRERKLIRKIEEAIKRIEDGNYGYCVETGEEIGIKRLEARPVATMCVEAQERRERREKQYGDRDDRYR
ncbi:MAG TPA: RNA polymerase-binding protein DksA [Steroidobacter sp.]